MLDILFPISYHLAHSEIGFGFVAFFHIFLLAPAYFCFTIAYYKNFRYSFWGQIGVICMYVLFYIGMFYRFPSGYHFAGYERGAMGIGLIAMSGVGVLLLFVLFIADISGLSRITLQPIQTGWLFRVLMILSITIATYSISSFFLTFFI